MTDSEMRIGFVLFLLRTYCSLPAAIRVGASLQLNQGKRVIQVTFTAGGAWNAQIDFTKEDFLSAKRPHELCDLIMTRAREVLKKLEGGRDEQTGLKAASGV